MALTARLTVVALAAVLAAGAAAATTGNFTGTARRIAPTQAEIGYRSLTSSMPAPRPPADKRRGYRSGWEASYVKGTAAAPVQALVLVYVYATPVTATLAFSHSCPACTEQLAAGVRLKFQLGGTSGSAERTVTAVGTCRNVYAAIVVGSKQTPDKLGVEAGVIAGAIFRKAAALGMTPCSSR
jgi:hypothetical protein